MAIARYVILAISGGAMVVGVLVVAGVLVPKNLPEEFRLVSGIVVFLYGLYRFVVEYVRKSEQKRSRRNPSRRDYHRADRLR